MLSSLDTRQPPPCTTGAAYERIQSTTEPPQLADAEEHEEQRLLAPAAPPPEQDAFSWRKLCAFAGPGFVMCIAYVDPANLESDIVAGTRYKYSLLWVLLWATAAGLLLQSLAVRLALATGWHLARACREEYHERWLRTALWAVTEVAIVASDIPEVLGTAFALKMLCNLPLPAGVVLTALDSLAFLALSRYGVTALEAALGALVGVIGICWLLELCRSQADGGGIVAGLLVPRVQGAGAAYIGVSLIGAVVMPHNLYLHSGLVLSREVPRREAAVRMALTYNMIESSVALAVSLFINVAVVSVAAASMSVLPDDERQTLLQSPLQRAPALLRNTLGKGANTAFALSLLASGQSSTVSGTYAGQFVMEGFLDLKMSPAKRALLTRTAAIGPALAASLIAGAEGAEKMIVACSVVLSIALPFALVPLIKLCASPAVMGVHVTGVRLLRLATVVTLLVICANIFLVAATLADTLAGNVAAAVFVILLSIAYLVVLALLTRRPVHAVRPPGRDDVNNDDGSQLLVMEDQVGGAECGARDGTPSTAGDAAALHAGDNSKPALVVVAS
jgi:NRAMP (natural resistance-associated macrophage protein)-like metal ion transporter